MNTHLDTPRLPWTLLALALAAGTAALSFDYPLAAASLVVPVAALAMAYLLTHPQAWVMWFLALGLLVPLLPFSVGAVELPVHPAMLVFAAGCFVVFVRWREWRVEWNALTITSALLIAALALSLPWAFFYSGSSIGWQSVFRWTLLVSGFLLFAWVAYGPRSEAGEPAHLIRMLLFAALLTSAFALVDFVFQLPRTVRFSDQYIYGGADPLRRAQGVFYDASTLGNFCAMMLTLMFALGRRARQALNVPAWLLWIPAPTLAVALVVSFSRGSVFNLMLACAVLAWMRRRTLFSARTVIAALVLVGVIAVTAVIIAPQFLLPYGNRLLFTASEFFARPNEVLSKRLDTWQELVSIIADNPLQVAAGIGYKSLPYTEVFGHRLVADNMYFSLLMEAGIPGLAALLAFCAAVLATAWRLARSPSEVVAGLGRFLFAFWIGEMAQMLSGDILTYWRVTPVYLALLGLALRKESAR